jgi:serine/threonine protein kinase
MNSESPEFFYTLLNPDFFEDLGAYQPAPEYRRIVEKEVGSGWQIKPEGFWTHCRPNKYTSLVQGWKIHISAMPSTAVETLVAVVSLFVDSGIEFKFCSDATMLRLSLNKNWPRTGTGKFITAYPKDERQFISLIDECHCATKGFVGPYILSDRPFRDSKVVFYRYGEHSGVPGVNWLGRRVPRLQSPDGELVSDERLAYFWLPPWVRDPFSDRAIPVRPSEDGILLGNRYRVMGAIKFSSTGGIYMADDTATNEPVIIREARPHLQEATRDFDVRAAIAKEARILQRLGPAGVTPRFIDLFEEWDHSYLIQERLGGAESLWGHAMNLMFEEKVTPAMWFERVVDVMREIVRGLELVHAAGVVLRDVTRNNVMFTPDGRVHFVDLEFAFETDRSEPPVAGWSPGYASQEQLRTERPKPAEDYYALGVLLLDMIAFTAPGYDLNRDGTLRAFRMALDDLRLPRELLGVVEGLTAREATKRWTAKQALNTLERIHPPTCSTEFLFHRGNKPRLRPSAGEALRNEIALTVTRIGDFILAHTDLTRRDRLWPCSGDAFHTNPIQLEFGATGTLLFLIETDREVPEGTTDWIVQCADRYPCPPGLMSGLAGVALGLLAAGLEHDARRILARSARDVKGIFERKGFYFGAAGWGTANLHFWRATGEAEYLHAAVRVGDELLRTQVEDEKGLSWDSDGVVELGFGQGQAGIAAFLTFLYCACGRSEFLAAARRTAQFEIEHRWESEYDLLWFPNVGASPGAPKSPHVRHGTAGIGGAIVRCYAASGDGALLAFAERCAHVVSRRQTNKIWYDYGLAGYGEFLIDMYQFTGDDNYLNTAFHLAEAILPFRIERDEGFAFPGNDLLRISCDFGMGSAGIGIFLNRLLNPDRPRLLMPDDLLRVTHRGVSTAPASPAALVGALV